jgi:protein phosphatase
MTTALRYAARTHLGLGPKSRNEDSGYAGPHLLVLADGMGGHAAGDVASSMIVGTLAPLDEEIVSGEQALGVLESELREANAQLRAAMREDSGLAGMGATTIAMLRSGNKLAMAHIGDSRAYLLREGTFSQITKDHSFVQQLVDEHRITEAEAQHHPQRSLVTRVMTGNPDDQPDLSIRELIPGDRYLLCSDGLTDFVSPDIVAEIVAAAQSPEEAAERCIELALKASTRDNVTVVVADVVDSDDEADLPSAPEIVGAAAVRGRTRRKTRAIPVSPAEKAAALTREVSGTPEEEPLHLAEEATSPRILWVRRAGLALAAAVLVVGAGYAGYDWTQRQYFLGAQDGYVTLYRGVNQTLGPVHLATFVQGTDILVTDLPLHYQELITASISLGGLAEADGRIASLRQVAAECRLQNATGIACGTTLPVATPTFTLPTQTATATSTSTAASSSSSSDTATSTSTPTGTIAIPVAPGAT